MLDFITHLCYIKKVLITWILQASTIEGNAEHEAHGSPIPVRRRFGVELQHTPPRQQGGIH